MQAISSYAGSVKNKAVATAIKSADTEFSGMSFMFILFRGGGGIVS